MGSCPRGQAGPRASRPHGAEQVERAERSSDTATHVLSCRDTSDVMRVVGQAEGEVARIVQQSASDDQ